MTPERWQKIKRIFGAVLEQSPEQQSAFLDRTCGDDLSLRAEVESLIAFNKPAEDFLESPVSEAAGHLFTTGKTLDFDDSSSLYSGNSEDLKSVPDPLIGRTLGDFIVREKLGQGGFGVVYRADQISLPREAVIKVLHKKHHSNKDVIDRFALPLGLNIARPMVIGHHIGDQGGIDHQFPNPIALRLLFAEKIGLGPSNRDFHV